MSSAKVSSGKSVRIKILSGVVAVLALILMFVFTYFPTSNQLTLIKSFHDKLTTMTEFTAFISSAGILFDDIDAVNSVIEGLKGTKELDFVVVRSKDGYVLTQFGSISGKEDLLEKKPEIMTVKANHDVMVASTPVDSAGEHVGYLSVGFNKRFLKIDAKNYKIIVKIICIIIMFLSVLVTAVLVNLTIKEKNLSVE